MLKRLTYGFFNKLLSVFGINDNRNSFQDAQAFLPVRESLVKLHFCFTETLDSMELCCDRLVRFLRTLFREPAPSQPGRTVSKA